MVKPRRIGGATTARDKARQPPVAKPAPVLSGAGIRYRRLRLSDQSAAVMTVMSRKSTSSPSISHEPVTEPSSSDSVCSAPLADRRFRHAVGVAVGRGPDHGRALGAILEGQAAIDHDGTTGKVDPVVGGA